MLRGTANFISYLFHPLFTTFYVCVIGIFLHPTIKGRLTDNFVWQLLFLLCVSLVVIPAMSLIIVKQSGYVSSWKIEKRKERIIPFIIVGIMMLISSFRLFDDSALSFCGSIALAAGIGLLINIPFLYWWNKPSAHAMAIFGGATAFLAEGLKWHSNSMLTAATILFLLAGVISTARLLLNAHTFLEILLGALIGISVILPLL